MSQIAPSIFASDFSNLKEIFAKIKNADLIHLDIMDGHFVPNISYGPYISKCISQLSNIPLHIHLMIERPDKFWDKFIFPTTSTILFHIELLNKIDIKQLIYSIKQKNIKVGLAINPDTSIKILDDYIPFIEEILIMSVNPGYSGQQVKLDVVSKIKHIKKKQIIVSVDGGIKLNNKNIFIDAGADILVVGSGLFSAENVEKKLKEFQK